MLYYDYECKKYVVEYYVYSAESGLRDKFSYKLFDTKEEQLQFVESLKKDLYARLEKQV